MQYIWHFEAASIMLSCVMIAVFIMRKSLITRAWKIFLVITSLNLAASITNLLSVYPGSMPVWGLWLVNIAYLTTFNMTTILAYWYLLGISTKWKQRRIDNTVWHVCISVTILLIVSSPLTGWAFRITPDGTYSHGPLFIVLWINNIIPIVYNIWAYIRHRRDMEKVHQVTFVLYVVTTAISMVGEGNHPEWLIGGFVTSSLLVMVYALLENPEIYLFRGTDCYNERALAYITDKLMERKEPFTMLYVRFMGAEYLQKLMGTRTTYSLMSATTKAFREMFERDQVYAVSRERFVILLSQHENPEIAEQRIRERFGHRLIVANSPVVLSRSICRIPSPSVLSRSSELEGVLDLADILTREIPENHSIELTTEMIEQNNRREKIGQAIRLAIQNGSIELAYQPIYDTRDQCYHTFEANARLSSSDLQDIPIGEIILEAERSGLILALGDQIIKKLINFWSQVQPEQYGIRYGEVNLSALQCIQPDLVNKLQSDLRKYHVSPSRICYEVTETAAVSNDDLLKQNMEKMTDAGLIFALDDYGTGYSNVTRLSQLPFSLVKLDRTLVWAAMKSNASLAILRNTIQLLHDLHKIVVAEGVETEEMKLMLDELGCEFYQGYYFSRPLSEEDFIAFLQEHRSAES